MERCSRSDQRIGEITLWETGTGKRISTFTGNSDEILSIAFSPDGKTLASSIQSSSPGSIGNHYVLLWNVETGTQIAKFSGAVRDVTSVAFSPDGELLASGSRDNSIFVTTCGIPGKQYSFLSNILTLFRPCRFPPRENPCVWVSR